jgi:tetratricopeptide (TPR) repeat protein
MFKLTLLLIALMASFAIGPTLHAAGMDSGPPNARPADADYDKGKQALEDKNWKLAIESFGKVASRDSRDADVQNYLGFAWRKAGNLDMAFKHYNEALRIDPGHKGAHEYIGEAYLMVNNVAKAEEHLARLDKLCLFSCEEYRDLKKAIEAYKAAHQGTGKSRS